MEEMQIYKGRGTADMRDDYLDFINLVFGFNGHDKDFLKLLPKLYKEEYKQFILEKNKLWQRAFFRKEYKLWLLLSGHY